MKILIIQSVIGRFAKIGSVSRENKQYELLNLYENSKAIERIVKEL